MKYTVNLVLNKEYFSEAFSQSYKYANKWRNVELFIGSIFILLGICLIILCKGQTVSPTVLIMIGLFEIFSPFFKKLWWIYQQMKSKTADSEVKIIFSESGIESTSQYTQTIYSWEGIEKMKETPKGVCVWLKNTIMYLPKSMMEDDVIQYTYLVRKINIFIFSPTNIQNKK